MQDFYSKMTGERLKELEARKQGPVNIPQKNTEPDPNQDLYNQLLGMSSQRILGDTLKGLQEQQEGTSRTYSQMYQDLLRNQRMQRGLSDTSGFSGGMAEQYSDKLSAAQMAALGQVGIGRAAAMSDIQSQRRMAPYDALTQAVQFSQTAQALDPRRQQAEVYAAAGDIKNWVDIMNEIYGTKLKYDPKTGGILMGEDEQPVVTPTSTPEQRAVVTGQGVTPLTPEQLTQLELQILNQQ